MEITWDDIVEGSIWELGIRPGYYFIVDKNTGETTVVNESYLIKEKEGNEHLKLIHSLKYYEFKCASQDIVEDFLGSFLDDYDFQDSVTNGFCPYYPHSLNEYRILCETWLTDENHIFINGQYEGFRGVEYNDNCNICQTILPVSLFLQPYDILYHMETYDPIIAAFYNLLKSRVQRIVNGDMEYGSFTKEEIAQYFIDIIPAVLDFFFIDKPLPYGGFGPSVFIKDKLPTIETKEIYYIKPNQIDEAVDYFINLQDVDYIDPSNIILN